MMTVAAGIQAGARPSAAGSGAKALASQSLGLPLCKTLSTGVLTIG